MDFDDYGWTALAIDGDEESDEAAKGASYTQQTGVMFVVDCGPPMFVKHEDEASHFEKCLKCIRQICQKKVITNEKDMLAVVFYGVNKSSVPDGKAIYVYQDLAQLNIQRITDLESLLEDPNSFVSEYGYSDNYDISEVLWACSNTFAKSNKSFGEKKILLFTCDDNPHKGNAALKKKAIAKATDLKSMNIDLELLALNVRDEKATFNMDLFYKDLLFLGDENSLASYPDPSEKFEDLLSTVYRKEHKRRALGRIPFKIGNNIEFSVGVYCLCRKAVIPPSVKIHSATNSEVRSQSRVFNAATGEDVMPQDIKSYQQYANKRICFDTEEATDYKKFNISGLKLKGFIKKAEVKLHLHVKPSHFIYPDESVVKGSSTLFSALLSRCAARDMVAVCHYVPRTNSNLELVYLLPQLEEKDEANNQVTPPGFHVVFCPFKEDMRDLSAVDHSASANTDQVEKCKALIEKLSFPYQTSMFENPSLQKFYSNLEAMALSKDEPEEVTDYTAPNTRKIEKKAGAELEAFSKSVFSESTKRPAPASSTAGAKKAKVDNTSIDIKQLALTDGLGKLTVADLKGFLKSENIKSKSTKKADIIQDIKSHYGV